MESETHKRLKRIGMYWLKTKVTDLVCVEAKYRNLHSIADVAGINLKREEVRIMECKATMQDFKRDKKLFDIDKSYYKHCHYFYIMCPENIIQINDIPKEYGLLWVNDKDEVIVKQSPIKYKGRLKTMYKTSLKNISRAITNTLLYYFDNQDNKDETNKQFKRNASVFYSALTCPTCHKVTKLLNNNKGIYKCKHCKQDIDIQNCKNRVITAYNDTFMKEVNRLWEKSYSFQQTKN